MSGFLQCKIEAETIGSELQNEDVTHHMICPACKGGESGEKSFVVFTDEVGGIGGKCHRASCDQKGFMDSKGYLRMGQQIPEPPISPKFRKRGHSKPLKPFTGKVEELTRQQKLFLRHTIGFTQYHIQRSFVGYHNDSGRYVFPILDSSLISFRKLRRF